MVERKWCLACALSTPKQHSEAKWIVDGDLMCDACKDLAPAGSRIRPLTPQPTVFAEVKTALDKRPAVMPSSGGALCDRSCGQPRHRGRCKGSKQKPYERIVDDSDDLGVEYVALSEVPAHMRHGKAGRIGALWQKLIETPKDGAMKIKCRNNGHAGKTITELMKRARESKLSIAGKRVGAECFFQWVDGGTA